MSTGKQLKSILKKTPNKIKTEENRNYNIALQHANLIQQRKNFELEILLSTETLIDYPLTLSPADASNPSPTDKYNFRKLIRLFQPNDYDDLIIERNINDRCGYTLCPNRNHKEDSPGKFRLLGTNGKAKDFRVVEKRELEKWCSDTCAIRAMYVRAQLNEIPAWERSITEFGPYVDLLVGSSAKNIDTYDSFAGSDVDASSSQRFNNSVCTAIGRENGSPTYNSSFQSLCIQEKDIIDPVKPPLLEGTEADSTSHLKLEGYTTMSNISIRNLTYSEDVV